MLVAVVHLPFGTQLRYPGYHTIEVVEGGVLHIKDHNSFQHYWSSGDWLRAWTEEEPDE